MCHNSAVCLLFLSCLFIPLTITAQDSDQSTERHEGTAPRASAAKYHSHAEKDGFSLGAELVSKHEASRIFAADINSCCLVVQVAVYPKKNESIELSLIDFSLVEINADKTVRPESPTTVSAKLESEKDPRRGGVDVTTSAGVGYESGSYTDPVTGQPVRVHSVSRSVSVSVSNGNSTPPDIAERDREVIERELYEKGLPGGKVSIPVAGYLYFPLPHAKKDSKYQLVYSRGSESLTLPLP